MTGIVLAFDATGSNYGHLPPGQHAGYVTGSGGIAWSAAQWAQDPGAVKIDQSPVNTALDELADVLDYENGAATLADIASWTKAAQANFAKNARPGQRKPVVYASQSNISAVVNALLAGGITSGAGLWFAHYGVSEASAAALVGSGSGPFPVVAFQFTDTGGGGTYDISVFSQAWLGAQSGMAGNTVSQGSSGPAVTALQRRLGIWGHSVLADGLFGAGTLAALKAFQAARKLVVDGVAGPATWSELEASPVVPVPPANTPVPAPLDLKQSVAVTAAAATFGWGAVAGVSAYRLQIEFWKSGFGWVLSNDQGAINGLKYAIALAPRTHYRWRCAADVDGREWPGWVEFSTP